VEKKRVEEIKSERPIIITETTPGWNENLCSPSWESIINWAAIKYLFESPPTRLKEYVDECKRLASSKCEEIKKKFPNITFPLIESFRDFAKENS
jgi:hypothetical protein